LKEKYNLQYENDENSISLANKKQGALGGI